MHRKTLLVGFLAGLAAAVALMIVFSTDRAMPRAVGQAVIPRSPVLEVPPAQTVPPPEKAEVVEIRAVPAGQAPAAAAAPRYQIATWAHPAAYSDAGASSGASHGAYILDTQSGEVWRVNESQRPRMIQKIGKVGAE